jgi:2-methylcitrate dehydratase PrpD
MVARAGSRESTVFNGRGGKADRFSAAVANGAAADWCELDEGYRRATCHAGLYTIPALIAEAEATGASTEDTLRALVLGYEVAARFARAFPPKTLVLHPHASLAAIGAAAGVGALRRLDAALLNSALTSASTMVAPGPYRHAVEGALVRNVWPAAGAWCGMQAVEWAECGIGGAPHSPYDVFVMAFGSKLDADQFAAGLGAEWAIADGYHKVHACCQYSHSTVEAIIDLHGRLGERMQSIHEVRVETHPLGMTLNNREPATSLAAKFSIPHIAAAACLYGNAGAEAFAGARLNEAPLALLREKVALAPYENVPAWPNDRPARVTVTLDDGSAHTSECISARGGPDKPFGPDIIEAKINGIMASAYPNAAAVMKRCIALDRSVLGERWRDVVASLAR